jgi:predicted permease
VLLILLLVVLVAVIGGGVLFVRFAKTLEPRQRVMLVVVAILVAAYFLPKMIQAAIRGFRAGAEISQRQGR